MNEKVIEKKLRERVKKLGGIAVKFFPIFFRGFPDRMVLMPGGKISFAEIKTTGKKPNPVQKIVIEMLRKLGFWVEVIDTMELLDEYLIKLENA